MENVVFGADFPNVSSRLLVCFLLENCLLVCFRLLLGQFRQFLLFISERPFVGVFDVIAFAHVGIRAIRVTHGLGNRVLSLADDEFSSLGRFGHGHDGLRARMVDNQGRCEREPLVGDEVL